MIQARAEGGYGDRAAGVGAQQGAIGGAQGGDRVICSQDRRILVATIFSLSFVIERGENT
jgi:hypothetical protein